jgi:hypothetical protein
MKLIKEEKKIIALKMKDISDKNYEQQIKILFNEFNNEEDDFIKR